MILNPSPSRASAAARPASPVYRPNLAIARDRREQYERNGSRVFRAMATASGVFVVLLVAAILLHPLWKEAVITFDLPVRSPTVILPEPIPEALPAVESPPIETLTMHEVQSQPDPVGAADLTRPLPRELRNEELAPDAGTKGRERAREATSELSRATAALDGALDGLASSLRSTSGAYEPTRRRRGRGVRSGRSDAELASVDAGSAGSGANTDLRGSTVEAAPVAIGEIGPSSVESNRTDEAPASRPGAFRTNASLLAVIQRYAAGIQFCYTNELKRDPAARGKLVVAMTVAASGQVLEATIVQNTVGSARLADCALAQILQWRFPAIPQGVTTFQAPFVFTPPP